MTTLKERLTADRNTNLKAHNELETTTLRNMLGAIQSAEKSGKVEQHFDDAQVQALLAKEVKKREATADEYLDAALKISGSDPVRAQKLITTAAREQAEAKIIEAYLPQQLNRQELEHLVDTTIADLDNPKFGDVMKAVTTATKGRADGKTVSEIVRARLAG